MVVASRHAADLTLKQMLFGISLSGLQERSNQLHGSHFRFVPKLISLGGGGGGERKETMGEIEGTELSGRWLAGMTLDPPPQLFPYFFFFSILSC